MASHLLLTGDWTVCEDDRTCELKFHIDMEPAAVKALPKAMLWQLLEAVDPPHRNHSGLKEWVNELGQLDRAYDLPAVINPDGTLEWYRRGVQHRGRDLPAVEAADGSKKWYRRGKLHRLNDQPAVVKPDGEQQWYVNGLLHRTADQPALISQDGREWYRLGQVHREGAPAVIRASGKVSWYLHNKQVSAFVGLGVTAPKPGLRLDPLFAFPL